MVAVAAASVFPPGRGHAGEALGSTGESVLLSDAAVADLRKSIAGELILPSSPGYEVARRVWSPIIDRRPALIARCTSVSDIKAALQFARRYNVLTAVRCGGHSAGGYAVADGALVIDLGRFNGVEVDPERKIAWVSGGALLGDLDRATASHGLATTAGVVSHTGVGGLATACGQGRLARKYGYTIDNIRGVEMLTPDGRLLVANAHENPDLYWAIRGGGGNFGIVTKFEFQLHEFDPHVTSFSYAWPLEKGRAVFESYFELSAQVPAEMSLGAALSTSHDGETTASLSGTYLGAPEAAEKLLASIGRLGAPLKKRFEGFEYVKLQSIGDGPLLSSRSAYDRSGFFNHIDARLSDVVVDQVTKVPMPGSVVRFTQQGGMPSKVAVNATAFADRDAQHQCIVSVDWTDPKDATACRKHADDTWNAIAPLSDGGFYINWATHTDDAQIRRTFRGNYPRLVKVKTQYDPTNFLHLNPNIKPRAA